MPTRRSSRSSSTRPRPDGGGPPGGRRRARRGEGDRLREEILEATAALLVEHGTADRVSTRAVAQRVGCSSPALYLHFPDKATLVYAVCERQFTELGRVVDEAVAGEDDPVERLRIAGHAYANFALDHPEQYRIMMMDEEYGQAFQTSLEDLGAQAGMTSIVQAVRDGMDRGVFARRDPMLTVIGLWASIHGLVSLRLAKPGIPLPPLDDLIDLAVQHSVEGLRARDR
jgi:AcrR family transcriptional regulator